MKKNLLLQLAKVMGSVNLSRFCPEWEARDASESVRCRRGAENFLTYVAKYGTLPPGCDSFEDECEIIESILLQGGE